MEKEPTCENGTSSVREQVTIVSWESSSARANNRSIRAVLEAVQKWPVRSAISDLYACSSNPPNYQYEHNSPSPPINAAELECTKCEPAGVHEKNCEIFQLTGSVLNDSSVSARLVGVSQSGFGTFGRVVCDSVRTEGSDLTDDKHVRYSGLLHAQGASNDNSKYAGLLASSGNSESIFRSYVINHNVSSKEVASECIPACCSGESKAQSHCTEETLSAERLGSCYQSERSGSNCCDIVKTDIRCDCCSCIVSSGLSEPAATSDHQKTTLTTRHVCHVNDLRPSAVSQARTGLSVCEILPSDDPGTESSESAGQVCHQAIQCNCYSTKNTQSKSCKPTNCSHADNDFNRVTDAFVLALESTTGAPLPSCETCRSYQSTSFGSCEKLCEPQDSAHSVFPSLQCPVELFAGEELNHCCVRSKEDDSFDSATLNSCVDLEKICDIVGTSLYTAEVDPNVDSIDVLKIQQVSEEVVRCEQEDKGCVSLNLHAHAEVEFVIGADTLNRNTPERILAINDGTSLELDSLVHNGAGQRFLSSEHAFISPVSKCSDADSSSGGGILQKNHRIEVSPGVRRGLIQISRSLQKKQDRVRTANGVKAVTHKEVTDTRSKSVVESRRCDSSNSKEHSGNTKVQCGRQKKLNDAHLLLVLTSSCRANPAAVKNDRESRAVPVKSTSSSTSNGKCKLHAADNKSSSIACRSASCSASRNTCGEQTKVAENKSEILARNVQQKTSSLTCQKRKVVVRQTRASILRCTGQQHKTPDTTLTEDTHESLLDTDTVKVLRSTIFSGGCSRSTGKSAEDRTARSRNNVNRLRTRSPAVFDKVMANAGIVSKRPALVKSQRGPEKQAVKVRNEVKTSKDRVGHILEVNMADVHTTLKDGMNSVVKTDVAKVSGHHSQSRASKTTRQLNSVEEVAIGLTGVQQEKKSTNDSKRQGKTSLARLRLPASAPGRTATTESPSAKKTLNISGVSAAVQAQPPVLSLAECADVTAQGNMDKTALHFLPTTVDNSCEVAVNSDISSQPCTKLSPRLKQLKSSAPLTIKSASAQSSQGTRQTLDPSLSVKDSPSTRRPQPFIHSSSLSSRVKSSTLLSSEQKQFSKESTLSSSSVPSVIKRPTSRPSNGVYLSTPKKDRLSSNLLKASKYQHNGLKESKLTNIQSKGSESTGSRICKDVTRTTVTAQKDQCQNQGAQEADCVESSSEHPTSDVHTDTSLIQQYNTAVRRSIPRYSKNLIKDIGKNNTQREEKESVLKSILIDTSDRKLNGQADLPAVIFHKPMKEEDNTLLYSGDCGEGLQTYPCPGTINSSSTEYETSSGICGGALELTGLRRKDAPDVIEADQITGNSYTTQNRTVEVSRVTAGEGRGVLIEEKTRQKIAVDKTVKENKNMQVRKRSPNLPAKQGKITALSGHQPNSFNSDRQEVITSGLCKKIPISYLPNGRKNYSNSTAGHINHLQTVQTRSGLIKTDVPNKIKSEQSLAVKFVKESSKRLNRTVPKQTTVTRTQPSFKSKTESRSPGMPRVQVKSMTSALETSVGSCSESTASVLSELSSSSSSFLSCEQTTPETEDEKLCINQTGKRVNEHKPSHGVGYKSRYPTATSAVAGSVSVIKPSRAPPHLSKEKTQYKNIAVVTGSQNPKTRTVKHKTEGGEREITQGKYARELQREQMKTGNTNCEPDIEILITSKQIEPKGSTQLVDGPLFSKLPVLNDHLMNGVAVEESEESLTKKAYVFMDSKEHSVSDRLKVKLLETLYRGLHEHNDTCVLEVQLVQEERVSNATAATKKAERCFHGLKQAVEVVGVHECYVDRSSENREPLLDVVHIQPVVVQDSTTNVLSSLTGSGVLCLADSAHQVPILLHAPPIDQADRPQIATEASECKQGVPWDTPIGGESAGDLNASDIDSSERARSGCAQRKEAGGEEKEKKAEESQTAISYKRTQQDRRLHGILPSDIKFCDSCNRALYSPSMLNSLNTSEDTAEITHRLVEDFSTNGIHSHKDMCEFRCLDITQKMSSVSELHFESTRNKLGCELLMANSSEEIHSRICCHCISTQKATETIPASVQGAVRNGDVSSVFGLSVRDPEGHQGVSSCDSPGKMAVGLGSDETVTGVNIAMQSYKFEPTQPVVNVEVSSIDQVSGRVHVNGVTYLGPVSDTQITVPFSQNCGNVPTPSSHISEHLDDPVISSSICGSNCYRDEDVRKDKGTSNNEFESNTSRTESRELFTLLAETVSSITSHDNTPHNLSDSYSVVGLKRGNDVTERDDGDKQMDLSVHKFTEDTMTSLLSQDESFYSTPVGRSFHQDTRKDGYSQDSSRFESVFSPVDDDEMLEYIDDSDDKNDTESSASSDSSFHSATSDILTTTESTPERELASGEECQITADRDELHTFVTPDSKRVPADIFLDASLTPRQHHDSYTEFNGNRFSVGSFHSEEISVMSTPNGCNLLQQTSEVSPAKRSQSTDVSTTCDNCSLDTSAISQTLNASCPVSFCNETIAGVGIDSKEVGICQNKDVTYQENVDELKSFTEKWSDAEKASDDGCIRRKSFHEYGSDSCNSLKPISKLCDIQHTNHDLLSSLTCVDKITSNLACGDIGSSSNPVYTCSSATSFSDFASLVFSSSSQKAAETRYRQRQNSEEKMPSFLSMRSLSVESKKSGKNKSKSLPRSQSSFMVTSSTTMFSTVTPSIITSSTFPPFTMSSPSVIFSTMPSSVMATSTVTSPSVVVSSTKTSCTVTSLVMSTSTIMTSTAISSAVVPYAVTVSSVMNSCLSEPQSHCQEHPQQQQQQSRRTNTMSHCHEVNYSPPQERANMRQTHIAENDDKLITGISEYSIHANRQQLASTDKAGFASDAHRTTTDGAEKLPDKGKIVDGNRLAKTLSSRDSNKQQKISNNRHATPSRPTSIFKPKDKKVKATDESTHKGTHNKASQSCRKKLDNQEQNSQQSKLANEPDNLTSCKQEMSSNINEMHRKSSGHGEHIKQPKLASHKHPITDGASSRKLATDYDPESYLRESMEHPLKNTGIIYNVSNNPDKGVCEETVPVSECRSSDFSLHSASKFTSTEVASLSVSECTSTEFPVHSSADSLAFKTNLFESGYSSDIKSPEVKSPSKEFMDNHRQAVYANHRHSVQTVSDNMALNADKGNKITISGSFYPGLDLKCGIQSKTRETTLLDNGIETACKHSLEDLSPLSTETVKTLGCEIVRVGEISHFTREQYGKVIEGGAGGKISRGGYLEDLPQELSTLCRDNMYILGKSVSEVNRQNIAPDLSSNSFSNSCSSSNFPSVSKSVNDMNSTHQEQHSELAHNESFVDAKIQLQKHAAPSMTAFSDTIAISECLKLGMPNEYKHTSNRSDAFSLAKVPSNIHASGYFTQVHKEPALMVEKVSTNMDSDHLRAKHSCSEYVPCGCMVRNCGIHKLCTCAYTKNFPSHVSISTSTDLDEDNYSVCSYVSMSEQRTSVAQAPVNVENCARDIIIDSSSDSVHVGCKSNSVINISADHDNLNACIINLNMATEVKQFNHDKCKELISNRRSTSNRHTCMDSGKSVRDGDAVDSVKDVLTRSSRDDIASSSLESGDTVLSNDCLPVGNAWHQDVISLSSEIQAGQSLVPGSRDISSSSDDVEDGGLLQHDLYVIHYQAHLPQTGIADLRAALSIELDQELVESVSEPDTGTVSHVTLPGPIEMHFDETIHNLDLDVELHVSSDSSVTSCSSQDQQSMLVSGVSKTTDSSGDDDAHVPHVVYDVIIDLCDSNELQTGDSLPDKFENESSHHTEANIHNISDKKQALLLHLSENIEVYEDVSENADDGNREQIGASSNAPQWGNHNSFLTGKPQGPDAVKPSRSFLNLKTSPRQDTSGLQTSRRRSPTNRCEGLPKETSPLILERVCALLSKASANEQHNPIRPKSPLPHNDISRVTFSKNRPVTPDSKARARQERVIQKWRSMVEKSKAVRKEKSITVTFLSPCDSRSLLPPQISPTSMRTYKWERGDTGVWMKVYVSDEDNRDSQLIEYIDNGEECTEWDKKHILIHEPTANKATAPRASSSSTHSSKSARPEVDTTGINKSDATCTTATNCSKIKMYQQSNDNCLQCSETLSSPEDRDNTYQESRIQSSVRFPQSEDHKEDNNNLVEQKVDDITDNKATALMSKPSDLRESDVRAFNPKTRAVDKTCDTEATRLIQHAGSLQQNNDNRTERKLATETADQLKRADKLEQKTRVHIWPTVTESLRKFQKSRSTVPCREHFKREQGHLDTHWKHKSPATEKNKIPTDLREERTVGASGFSSVKENSYHLITDNVGNCTQSDRTSLSPAEESRTYTDAKDASILHNVSHYTMKEPSTISSDSKISAARNTLSISGTGRCARPQTLEPPGQISAKLRDSGADILRTVERNIKSCWAAPSASERTLPPSPVITLPPDSITTGHSPQRTSPTSTTYSASVADLFSSEYVSISSGASDHADLSSSSDADSATPVVESVCPANPARNKIVPILVQLEQNNKQHPNVAPIPQPDYSKQSLLEQELFQNIDKQSSLAVSSYCVGESQATSAVVTDTEMKATLPAPTGEVTAQPGVRRHGPSTKLISVSVWDTHDGDKSLRNTRRLWASEDKHTLAEISEIEEAHTVHESIHGNTSDYHLEESALLQISDGCREPVRASRSPVPSQATQKPCPRRSLSLPSGGLSYGDVKILYRDGHFVLVDTSTDRVSKAASDTSGTLDDVFEEAEGADQSVKDCPRERNGDGSFKSKTYSESKIDDTVRKTKNTSLSFDSCDTGLNMRRCGFGGSIFSSLPRRKVHSQNSKSSDHTRMWRSQQSLMSQNERNRIRQKEEEEATEMCRSGPGLRRNNSFTEAMGSTVILTDRVTKRNHTARKHTDTLDDADNTCNSCQKEESDDLHSRKSRSKSPGFIQRMLQKRKGASSLSLSMSSLKPQNNDCSSSSLSLASSVSSTSLQHTSPGTGDSRDSSVGRKISFRGFFKRKNSADLSVKKNASSESSSSPPLAAFLSNDDIGATVLPAYTHTIRGTRHSSFIGNVCARESQSYSSYQRPRSSSTHVSASSSQSSIYRSRSHDENDRSPIAAHIDSASRRARSVSERTGRGGRILSEEQLFSRESSSEFDLSSPDPHNSDGTLTPRSTSPCAADLSGDQTLLASPVLSQKPSHLEHHSETSNPSRSSKRTRSRGEESFHRTFSSHGDSSLSIITQRTDNGEIISSNSNDSGIQKDFSVNSSAESIQTATVHLRGSHSPSPTTERPKSDSTVRWADWVDHASQPWSVQHLAETNRQHKLPRATSETVEDFNDNGSENERNEDIADKKDEGEESSEGGIYTTEHRRTALLNASSLGNIASTQLTARGVRSASCCSTGSNANDMRLLMHSRESLMNLVELRRSTRDATSVKLAKLRRLSTPQPITVRTEKPRVRPARASNVPAVLTHAHSMPDNLDKLTRKKNYFSLIDSDSQSITSQQSICDNSSDESEYSMDYHDEKSLSRRSSHVMLAAIDQILVQENMTLAEALWDHVTMDPEELAFRAGDLISITDGSDKHWWFGELDGNEGWFPATFVRLRVNQDVAEEDLAFLLASDEALIISEARVMSEHAGKAVTATGYQGMQQARANVVNEIISAEREYVKHLHDVIEGYVKQAQKRPEMFPIEKVTIIFSNIEDIYLFATELLAELDRSVIPDQPHLSELGHCFLDKVRKFEMYSDYCNNHSAACEELRELYRNKRYRHFFEACRLLQEMIEIPLEGFLLTPVQKICKYHLQLAELLKFTGPDHPDFHQVQAALEAMKKIAMLINERKRKMESVEKLAAWQLLVDGWEGPDILDDSSELIYSGELNKINHAGWSQERYFFLFDHQLIYCKKDLLKKAGFCFKGRISMDSCEVINVADGREPQYNVTVRNAWKLRDSRSDKWYLLVAKTTVAKQRWLKAFQDERKRVKDDTENNFNIPYHVKQAVITNFKQKNTIQKPKGKGHLSRANTDEVISAINRVNAIATLPRTKNRHKVKSEGALDTSKKMKWFFFGKGKT